MKSIKTKLGIPAHILAVMVCVSAWVAGINGLLLLGGYVLLCEDCDALKKHTIKVFASVFLTYGAVFVVNILPMTLDLISTYLQLFDGSIHIGLLNTLQTLFNETAYYLQDLLLFLLGLSALFGKDMKIKPLDKLIDYFADSAEPAAETNA